MAKKLYIKEERTKQNSSNVQIYEQGDCLNPIPTSASFSSSSAINLEMFFMFPQARNKQD